jgi:hypothetical protein
MSSQSFAVYAAKGDLKLEDLSVSKGNIFVPRLAILEFILIRCRRKVLHCCRYPCDDVMMRRYDDEDSKTQQDAKTRQDAKAQQDTKMR